MHDKTVSTFYSITCNYHTRDGDVFLLVGCFEDLRRFSDFSAILDRDFENRG